MPSFFCAVVSQLLHSYNIFPQVALLFFVIFATVVKFTSVKKRGPGARDEASTQKPRTATS